MAVTKDNKGSFFFSWTYWPSMLKKHTLSFHWFVSV